MTLVNAVRRAVKTKLVAIGRGWSGDQACYLNAKRPGQQDQEYVAIGVVSGVKPKWTSTDIKYGKYSSQTLLGPGSD